MSKPHPLSFMSQSKSALVSPSLRTTRIIYPTAVAPIGYFIFLLASQLFLLFNFPVCSCLTVLIPSPCSSLYFSFSHCHSLLQRTRYSTTSLSAIRRVSMPAQTGRSCWAIVVKCSELGVSSPALPHFTSKLMCTAAQENATFANQFLGCCCNGEEKDVILGSEALLKSASMCQECYTTPPPVRKDLRVSPTATYLAYAYKGGSMGLTLFEDAGGAVSKAATGRRD